MVAREWVPGRISEQLASIRQFDRGDRHGESARDRTLPKPETETEVTVQGPSVLFEHPRETPSPVRHVIKFGCRRIDASI